MQAKDRELAQARQQLKQLRQEVTFINYNNYVRQELTLVSMSLVTGAVQQEGDWVSAEGAGIQ